MTVSTMDLAEHIGADHATNEPTLHRCLLTAAELLNKATEDAYMDVPEHVMDSMLLEVGTELWKRRDAPSSTSQYAVMDGAGPVRGPRDPLTQVWPIIRHYVVPGF